MRPPCLWSALQCQTPPLPNPHPTTTTTSLRLIRDWQSGAWRVTERRGETNKGLKLPGDTAPKKLSGPRVARWRGVVADPERVSMGTPPPLPHPHPRTLHTQQQALQCYFSSLSIFIPLFLVVNVCVFNGCTSDELSRACVAFPCHSPPVSAFCISRLEWPFFAFSWLCVW